jgi:hypothetical protein
LLDFMIAPSFLPCWGCIDQGCQMQFDACAQDCSCNKAVITAISCVDGGGSPETCFTTALAPGGDSTINALTSCLLQVGGECNCGVGGMTQPPPDASTCAMTGGGSTSGNGACSSTIQETCGSSEYQAVCACPQGRCVCFGDTTTVIQIDSCPYCPSSVPNGPSSLTPEQVFSLCGFPQ